MILGELDAIVAQYIQSWPDWLRPIMISITYIGMSSFLIGFASMSALIAWRLKNSRLAIAMVASLAVQGLNAILKEFIHRPRPESSYVTDMQLESYSFPSGHAFGATVVYGLVAYVAYRYLPRPWRRLAVAALVLLIFLIGLSRVYLGAHYPTDVLAGWLLGGIALLCIVRMAKP